MESIERNNQEKNMGNCGVNDAKGNIKRMIQAFVVSPCQRYKGYKDLDHEKISGVVRGLYCRMAQQLYQKSILL